MKCEYESMTGAQIFGFMFEFPRIGSVRTCGIYGQSHVIELCN